MFRTDMMSGRTSNQSEPQWAFPYEPISPYHHTMTRPSSPYGGGGGEIENNNNNFMASSPSSQVHGDISGIRDRGIPLSALHNVPVEQLPQPKLNEEEWEEYMKRKIDNARRPAFEKRRAIVSIPRALFEVKPKCYCPRIVTVGPLCRKLEPSPIDRCKALCVKEFMSRRNISNLKELVDLVIPNPGGLSNIYFGLPTYNFDSLQLLVSVDTIFFYEFLLFVISDCNPEDKISGYLFTFFNNEITFSQTLRDLFLMGNQLPMSFLKRIAELPQADIELNELVYSLQYIVWRRNPFMISHPESDSHHKDLTDLIQGISVLECEHLLDYLYLSCSRKKANSEMPEDLIRPTCRLPRASELLKVGIKFKARKGNISVIKYHRKKLRLDLPRLAVFDETEDILRNLVAYELTSKIGGDFCGYAIMMDSLIDTPEDLTILYRSGVLENHLGSDERLVTMWNEMCINISESSSQRWETITKSILGHYKSHWRVMYVEFCAKFFSRPWLWLSSIAAVLLLIMSALQTVYSVLAYYQS